MVLKLAEFEFSLAISRKRCSSLEGGGVGVLSNVRCSRFISVFRTQQQSLVAKDVPISSISSETFVSPSLRGRSERGLGFVSFPFNFS